MTTKIRSATQGRRVSGEALGVAVLDDATSGTSIVISVSRRVGNAVARNRVRRKIREIVRLGRDRLRTESRIRVSVRAVDREYAELERELWDLLERGGALK